MPSRPPTGEAETQGLEPSPAMSQGVCISRKLDSKQSEDPSPNILVPDESIPNGHLN